MEPQKLEQVTKIATEVARLHAADVDKNARFPSEAINALKDIGALGASLPTELGGWGTNIEDLTELCVILGRECAATAMVFAMHHIQVISLVNHALSEPGIEDYLRKVAKEQRLIASATSEVGPSGDMRQSVCHVEKNGDNIHIQKNCTTMSYVQHAQDILFQARRTADSAPSDQMMVLALEGTYKLENIGNWDTLGMRGTCSPGGLLTVDAPGWQGIDVPFGEVANVTMSPISHILWAGLWLGIGKDAESKARAVIRAKARKAPGAIPSGALDLSRLTGMIQGMECQVLVLAREYDQLWATDKGKLAELGFGLKSNNLKLCISEQLPQAVSLALQIAGIMAYKNDTEFSLGRHLRDAHSCALMVNNQRIHATNASTLLIYKGNQSRGFS